PNSMAGAEPAGFGIDPNKVPAPAPEAAGRATPAPIPAQPKFSFSPWTKTCSGEPKNVCGVLSKAQVETGQVAVAAALVQYSNGSQKLLRLTLPLGVRLEPGTRIVIDQNEPKQGYYHGCFATGCVSDFEANPDLIGKLKS